MLQLNFDKEKAAVSLTMDGRLLFAHSDGAPALFLGKGEPDVKMFRGNFTITDHVGARRPLRAISAQDDTVCFTEPESGALYTLTFTQGDDVVRAAGEARGGGFNRVWLRLSAERDERVTGGGEQFSFLNLRGRLFPIWTREQGVGRNKRTRITQLADETDGGGGDFHTTFFPQPTFISSRRYFFHLHNYDYAELDFRGESCHEIGVWNTEIRFTLGAGADYAALLEKLTALLGRQPALPEWAMKGLWLGVQGGTERATALRDRCLAAGVNVSAVWIQDWEGTRQTSFGKRNFWDWKWSETLYPGLDRVIEADGGRAWMGYINPYIVEEGSLCRYAKEHGYLVKRPDGRDYLFDFGEFNCGVVDLTLPAAYEWYKDVIKTNLIGFGLRGWMADFGEYLPTDAVCHGGDGWALHNLWPTLWAKCNREAVEESGMLGKCVFYMRAGGAQTQRFSTLMWAGDQNVDWSPDDGLPSAVTAALTLGMSGFGLSCSDAGGYTTLFDLRRDEELMKRWLEFSCFTPVMRSHEGNRPAVNVQLYDTPELLAFTARMTALHDALTPYLLYAARQNEQCGLPVMRPLFMAQDCDEAWRTGHYSYLLGDELLVAPVVEPGAATRAVWLPEGEWIHLWTGAAHTGGWTEVPAPLGQPPVFRRKETSFAALLDALAQTAEDVDARPAPSVCAASVAPRPAPER